MRYPQHPYVPLVYLWEGGAAYVVGLGCSEHFEEGLKSLLERYGEPERIQASSQADPSFILSPEVRV